MHLMYTLDAQGNRIYTLKVRIHADPHGLLTHSFLEGIESN